MILVTIGVVFVGVLQLMQMRIIETVQQRVFMRASFEIFSLNEFLASFSTPNFLMHCNSVSNVLYSCYECNIMYKK